MCQHHRWSTFAKLSPRITSALSQRQPITQSLINFPTIKCKKLKHETININYGSERFCARIFHKWDGFFCWCNAFSWIYHLSNASHGAVGWFRWRGDVEALKRNGKISMNIFLPQGTSSSCSDETCESFLKCFQQSSVKRSFSTLLELNLILNPLRNYLNWCLFILLLENFLAKLFSRLWIA